MGNAAGAQPWLTDDAAEAFAPLDAPPSDASLADRVAQLELQNAELTQRQATLIDQLEAKPDENEFLGTQAASIRRFERENGAFVLAKGSEEQPYALRADLFTEARYTNFQRGAETWTDSTGTVLPVSNFDSAEITRNFVQFSGYALDPNLQFTANIFSSTAINDTLYLGWINYRFSEALDVRAGNWLLPGTREWLESFRYTLGADRLMATTFFRPNISPGVWAQGEPVENVHYVAMLANSVNRFTQGVERVGSSSALSMTAWWEPSGDFGVGPSDVEWHALPSLRLGASMTFSEEKNQAFGAPGIDNPEDTIIRLSDGTPLFRPGALGPGVQLASTRVNLWAIDAALKYRGIGISGEYFFRLLDGFDVSSGSASHDSVFDHGGLLQGGAMIIPKTVEAFARTSFVTGPFGSGNELGGGVNWRPLGSREWRYTLEVLHINDSPAQNLLTGYRAGASGTLVQLQWFTDF